MGRTREGKVIAIEHPPLAITTRCRRLTPEELHERMILAYFLLWSSRPRDAKPDETGAYFIGEVSGAPEKSWSRMTPYSVAERRE